MRHPRAGVRGLQRPVPRGCRLPAGASDHAVTLGARRFRSAPPVDDMDLPLAVPVPRLRLLASLGQRRVGAQPARDAGGHCRLRLRVCAPAHADRARGGRCRPGNRAGLCRALRHGSREQLRAVPARLAGSPGRHRLLARASAPGRGLSRLGGAHHRLDADDQAALRARYPRGCRRRRRRRAARPPHRAGRRPAPRIRGAPRLRRGVSERGGHGGPFEAPHEAKRNAP